MNRLLHQLQCLPSDQRGQDPDSDLELGQAGRVFQRLYWKEDMLLCWQVEFVALEVRWALVVQWMGEKVLDFPPLIFPDEAS